MRVQCGEMTCGENAPVEQIPAAEYRKSSTIGVGMVTGTGLATRDVAEQAASRGRTGHTQDL